MALLRRFKAVVFDMDGTLIDAQMWHYEALNEALDIFGLSITMDDHLARFDGLPTRKKLEVLSEERGLPQFLFSMINEIKQERTLRLVSKYCFPRVEQLLLFQWLQERGVKLAVATNSIRMTSQRMLESAGVWPYLDVVITNEDVSHPKPHPEIYQVAAHALGLDPIDCIAVEDNHFGVESARSAGCEVLVVDGVEDVRIHLLEKVLGRG